MGALEDIAAERRRQVEAEGWSEEHDDEHADGSIAIAAAVYACNAAGLYNNGDDVPSPEWPWDGWSFKPSTPLRDLVKAGALIVADIERRYRAGERLNGMAERDCDFTPI